jgi:hypothetical protein
MTFRILLSYHYFKDADLDALFAKAFTPPYPEVFADSGAYSSFTQGVSIDRDAYSAWLHRWKHLFAVYANLDAIGSAAQTRANQQALEADGLAPLPVFHTGEAWADLEWYLERYPYLALGGMVPYARQSKKLMPWLIQCFQRASGRAVYHGFGCTGWNLMRSFPWYSVDSSTWGASFRFGRVPFFCARRGRFFVLELGKPATIAPHAAAIRALGFDPLEFADRTKNRRERICAFSALAYLHAAAYLRRHFGAISLPSRPDGLLWFASAANQHCTLLGEADAGLKLYLADSNTSMDTALAYPILEEGGHLCDPSLSPL